ncbi:MAG: hypothetical protein N2504_03190 [candidate division WOR-3 bacterium]|nr:hypothetical protein [candidate division WOR-3 bacterium]MCX7947575.1 hypothetical protein [candidate division WOR-3 bacterium]MDW8150460.1 hypothetical protein [candidate division WOR-3 bacterium]
MKRLFCFLILFGCNEELNLKIEDLNKFYIFSENDEIKRFFISYFDTNFYRFLEIKNLSELNKINNLIIILTENSREFYRFYKYINDELGYKHNYSRDGSFLFGIFGKNEEDLKFNIYKNRSYIDSVLKKRVYELAYKRIFYFGIDKEKTRLFKEKLYLTLDIPVGWRILDSQSISHGSFFRFVKENPKRYMSLYILNTKPTLSYSNISETRKLLMDTFWNTKISYIAMDKLCIDGNIKQGVFRSCMGYLNSKAYFYDISVIDSYLNNLVLYIVEIDAILSNLSVNEK